MRMLSWLLITVSRLRAMLAKRNLDREFDEELQEHLQLLADEYETRGMARDEARRAAILKLGSPEGLKEEHREQRGMPWLEMLTQDLRFATRTLRRTPGFTIVAVLSLALGIGANSALFSLVDTLLVKTLPVKDADRLVTIRRMMVFGGFGKPGPVARETYEAAVQAKDTFAEVFGYVPMDRPVVAVEGASEPSRSVWEVTPNFFSGLGVDAAMGSVRADSGVVIGHRFWASRFEANPSALGRTIEIDGRSYPIIGIAPPSFLGLSLDSATDIWMLTPVTGRFAPSMVARLQPGVDIKQAHARMDGLFRQAEMQPGAFKPGAPIVPRTDLVSAARGLSVLREQYERPLVALMVLVVLVLLITCTNIGNLLVVRNSSRLRELTLRTAIGAQRSRLMSQLMVESMVLAVAGGVLAWIIARWGVAALLGMLPVAAIPAALEFSLNPRMLAFTAAVSIASAMLFALAPAWRATQVDIATGLKSAAATFTSRDTRRLGRCLVAGQIALSVVLLTGAGLFLGTLRNMNRVDPGFESGNLLQVEIDTRGAGYGQGKVRGVYRQLMDQIAALPGVRDVSGVRNPLMTGAFQSGFTDLRGTPFPILVYEVGPRFFETIHMTLARGRFFSSGDSASNGPDSPLIVNEDYARLFIDAEDPIGRRTDSPAGTVVGVVKEAKLFSIRAEPQPAAYVLAMRREPDRVSSILVRTNSDPSPLIPAVQRVVTGIHPRLLLSVRTMENQMARNIARERMVASTSAFFGILGVVLAGIGLFGVASFTVTQRTSEWGIRIALGAGSWSVIRESLRDTAFVFSIGLVCGAAAAIAGARIAGSRISGLLFGLTPTDLGVVAAATTLMIAVAATACVIPALRATRVDPLKAIRYE
jgi:predicted permease